MSSRRRYYIFVGFIYGLEEKKMKTRSCLCRLPSAVNVMLKVAEHSFRAQKVYKSKRRQ